MALCKTDNKGRNERQSEDSRTANMVRIPGATVSNGLRSSLYRGSAGPSGRGRLLDRPHAVTNRHSAQVVIADGSQDQAESQPDPKDYPGALPHMLYAGRWCSSDDRTRPLRSARPETVGEFMI